jgi:hypothetical protein
MEGMRKKRRDAAEVEKENRTPYVPTKKSELHIFIFKFRRLS